MFRSKTRDIIIPQSEHAQLSGIIALLWGNDMFDLPDLNFDSFVKGVSLHDSGHGEFDTNEIGAMDEALSYKVDTVLVNSQLEDPIANIVAHYHILRLLKKNSHWTDLITKCEENIQRGLKTTGIAAEKFIWADKITEFCDLLSFDFCFEKPAERLCKVFPKLGKREAISIRFNFNGHETINIDPWPLRVEMYQGYIFGYTGSGYPDILQSVVRKYILLPG